MATKSANNPTLLDLAQASDEAGNITSVAEILTETNPALEEMTVVEGNLLTGHRSSVRTGLPVPTWRKMYGGVQPTKGTTTQVTDSCGNLEAYAEVDKDLADLNGNTAAFRLLEDRAHIEGMNQEMAETLFYGNETSEPEAFTGFAPRYNTVNTANAQNARNVIDGGGTGSDNASIWIVCWSPMTAFGIVPKGSKAGLMQKDLGEVTIEDADGAGGRMQGYRSHYKWQLGLVVKDWRYVVRIPNIDRSLLNEDASGSSADLTSLMFQGLRSIPNMKMGRCSIYLDKDVETKLMQQLSNKTSSSTLKTENVGGTMVTSYQGIPLRQTAVLEANEARVV
jgi:hypothetical protein